MTQQTQGAQTSSQSRNRGQFGPKPLHPDTAKFVGHLHTIQRHRLANMRSTASKTQREELEGAKFDCATVLRLSLLAHHPNGDAPARLREEVSRHLYKHVPIIEKTEVH